jgi:hypothetical protein
MYPSRDRTSGMWAIQLIIEQRCIIISSTDLKAQLTSFPCNQVTNPEVIMTVGLEVFVQLVIAAITMLPCLISAVCPWKSNFTTFSCKSFGIP